MRTLLGVVALILATLWLPWWLQAPLYVACLIFMPHRLLLYIPARLADVR